MIKTLTFALLHFTVAFSLAYLLTGNLIIGSLIALIEPLVNTVAFFFHDRIWNHPALSKIAHKSPAQKTLSFAILHFSVAFFVTYLLTGNAFIGGLMATMEPAINTIVFHFHERFWLRKEKAEFTLFCHHHEIKQHTKEIAETTTQELTEKKQASSKA